MAAGACAVVVLLTAKLGFLFQQVLVCVHQEWCKYKGKWFFRSSSIGWVQQYCTPRGLQVLQQVLVMGSWSRTAEGSDLECSRAVKALAPLHRTLAEATVHLYRCSMALLFGGPAVDLGVAEGVVQQ